MSNFQVLAFNEDVEVSNSVENHASGEIVLPPSKHIHAREDGEALTRVIEESLKAHGVIANIEMNMTFWDDRLESIVDLSGNLIENSGNHKWYVYVDGKYFEQFEFWDTLENQEKLVVRLIYNSEDSYADMNGLINKLATIDLVERPDLEVIYQEGLTLLLNNGDFEDYLIRLDAAINPVIKVDSIKILDENLTIFANTTHQLNYKAFPENHTEDVTFTSSDKTVATIDENGIIQAISKGDTIIRVHAGELTESIELTVEEVKAKSITFEEPSIQLSVGSHISLNPTILPSNTTSSPTYNIKDDGVLKLDHNRIIALQEGSTTVTATIDGLTAELEVNVEGEMEYTEPTVVFKHSSGAITTATNNVFNLSILDEGKFELLGADDIDLVDGVPFWDASKKIQEGLREWTHYFILTDGTFMPFKEGSYQAKVFDRTDATGTPTLLSDFTINIEKSNIASLKAYVDGQEIQEHEMITLEGSEPKEVKMKAVLENGDIYDLGHNALSYKEIHLGEGFITTTGQFGLFTSVGLPNPKAIFEIKTVDDALSFVFEASSVYVALEGFEVIINEELRFHDYNPLVGRYIGLIPEIKFYPSNATNTKLVWENLDEDIAEYIEDHNAGFVPKKQGQARFRVHSLENPNFKQELTLNFKYANPIKDVSLVQKEYTIHQFEEFDLDFIFNPVHATDKRFEFIYNKEDIVSITQRVYFENITEEAITSHTLYGENEGIVEVIARPIDTTNSVDDIHFKVNVLGSDVTIDENLVSDAKLIKDTYAKKLLNLSHSSYLDEWVLFTLLQTNQPVKSENIASYLNSVENIRGLDPTDYARILLVLGSINEDARYFVDKLLNENNLSRYPSNHAIWTLLALDTKNYESDRRVELIKTILKYQKEDGSFSLSEDSKTGSIDLTAMAIQAFSPYYRTNNREALVSQIDKDTLFKLNESVDLAIDYLASNMTNSAGFIGDGVENSNSASQVLTALSMVKIDVLKDPRFIRGDKNIISNLLSFKTDTGFSYTHGAKDNEMAFVQAVYALESYYRLIENRPSIYDFNEVVFTQDKSYNIIEQSLGKYLRIFIDAFQKDFKKIKINGKVLDPKHYTLSGTTIITIKEPYISTLKTDVNYTVEIMFNDKIVTTSFKLDSEKVEDEFVDGPSENVDKPSTNQEEPQVPNKNTSNLIVDKIVNKETVVEKLGNVEVQNSKENLNDLEDEIVEESSQDDNKDVLNESVKKVSKETLTSRNNIMMMAGIGLMISAVLLQIILRKQEN